MSGVTVTDNPRKNRYEAWVDGDLAGFAQYTRGQARITFTHTEVRPAYGGRGVGAALARASLDEVRSQGLKVRAVCPFYSGWIARHPEYRDLTHELASERLVLRPWKVDDAAAALGVYGTAEVARWLSPAMDRVPDLAAMRAILERWHAEDGRLLVPGGRWAIESLETGELVGGATLLPLPPDEAYEMGWQLHPREWGHGYATEAGLTLARWSFEQGLEEVISLVRPANRRAAATVEWIGMEWVGETDRYHRLLLQEYRLRPGDLQQSR
ncbi:GNAT family N-acetyltransferase [Spirillospora sp. NPDC052242]